MSFPNAPSNLIAYRAQNYKRFTFRITGHNTAGNIWGTNIYTDDSNLAKAVVHHGVLSHGQTGIVTFEIRPGQSSYIGSTKNGVTSREYGSYGGSYVITSEKILPSAPRFPNNILVITNPTINGATFSARLEHEGYPHATKHGFEISTNPEFN